jgi:hypothetical protein
MMMMKMMTIMAGTMMEEVGVVVVIGVTLVLVETGDFEIKDPNRLTYKVDGRSAADSDRLRDMRELAGKMSSLFGEQNHVVNLVTRRGQTCLFTGYAWELQTILHKISQQAQEFMKYFRRRSIYFFQIFYSISFLINFYLFLL